MTKTLLSTFALAVATLCLGCGSADGSATARVDEVHGAATFERGCDGVLSGACDRGCRSDTDCAHGSRCELTREGEFYRGRCVALALAAAGEGAASVTPEPSPPIRADVAWERDAGVAPFDAAPPSVIDAAAPNVIDAAVPTVDAAPPPVTAPSCANGSWERLPSRLRSSHTALAVGSKVFLFGGADGDGASVLRASLYDPQSGVETPLPKGGPDVYCDGASYLEAEALVVLVCGGAAYRLDLAANQWRVSAKTRVHERAGSGDPYVVYVPTARGVFLWNPSTRTGADYDARTDAFTTTPVLGAPPVTCCGAGASGDGSVYLWGGHNGWGAAPHSEGARLDLATMTWSPMPTVNAPAPQRLASLGFVAGRLMVLGGDEAAFDPKASAWSRTPPSGLPPYASYDRQVLVAGSKLVVVPQATSGAMKLAVYDAQANAWSTATTADAPRDRRWHAAALVGDDVIVHGGVQYGTPSRSMFDDGYHFAYSLAAGTWRHGEGEGPVFSSSASTTGGPTTAVWSERNKRVIAWGGGTGSFSGGQFDPVTKTWTKISMTNAPTGGWYPVSAWTGSKMLVHAYDGAKGGPLMGAAYDPVTDVWTPWWKGPSVTATVAPLFAVAGGKAVTWSGSGIWLSPAATGTIVDAALGSVPVSPLAGPGAVEASSTSLVPIGGSRLAVWGGNRDAKPGTLGGYVNDGFIFDTTSNSWSKMSGVGAPDARVGHGMAWTGSELFVWGGHGADGEYRGDGALYNPATDTWRPVASLGAPSARTLPLTVWTGSRVIVWGTGASGASYDPATDTWHCMPSEGALPGRHYRPLGIWTGSELVVMGGVNGPTNTVAIYRP